MTGIPASVAERLDARGTRQRIEFVPSGRGSLYTWLAHPPNARHAVVVCSPICADFSANYQRERALGHAVAARGIAVVRFHYSGEGNSDGHGSDLTFESLCDDVTAIVDHVVAKVSPDRLAFHGTRVGALVAATFAVRTPDSLLSLWEPVYESRRFFTEAYRAKRMSSVAKQNEYLRDSWQEELAQRGVLDLLGHPVYPNLVRSLEGVTLEGVLGDVRRPTLVIRFTQHAAFGKPENQMKDQPALTGDVGFNVGESWWFHDENVQEAGDVVATTTEWLARELGGVHE